MFPRTTASALAFMMAISALAPSTMAASCFTPDEVKAAHFRALQQEFNVAALNCRTLDPNDPGFSARYNDFVGRFGGKLQDNARALQAHFRRAGGNFDAWMTKVANDAGQRVFAEPDYCQQAWDHLDKVLAMAPDEAEGFAATTAAAHSFAPACSETKAKPTKKAHHARRAHHSHHTTSKAGSNDHAS